MFCLFWQIDGKNFPHGIRSGATAADDKSVAMRMSLPLELSRESRTRSLLDSLQKRVVGRRWAERDVQRTAGETGHLVTVASRLPDVEPSLQRIAADRGISLEIMRDLWCEYQQADLLLESGGDADAESVSHAIGAAQWMPGTAQGVGLKVDLREGQRLTAKIAPLKRQIAWLEFLTSPDADFHAPGAPPISREEALRRLPNLRAELEMLREKRRKADERYDPQKSITAQTRYLLRLYDRFPSVDWLFQAYHGGEGGVKRTLRDYCGTAFPGTPALAIFNPANGSRLTYEDLYFTTTPANHTAAFEYLYGRSDDHRHYWWKLRAAQECLALYRRDPAAFEKLWLSLRPGHLKETVWYPEAAAQWAFTDETAMQGARQKKTLVPVPPSPDWSMNAPTLAAAPAEQYAVLRPESLGALRLLTAAFRQAGGTERLELGDLTLPQSSLSRRRALKIATTLPALFPPEPYSVPPPDTEAKRLLGNDPPPDFSFHAAGLAFDIAKPADLAQKKRLDFALGWGEDRQFWWRTEETTAGRANYHVVPNPRYARALAEIGTAGKLPKLPGI